MAYIIKRTNGQLIFENGLQDNIIDAETLPVALIGRLTPDYGSYQSNNFIHLMEHFANDIAPANALKGTLWYNTSNKGLYICIAEAPLVWQKVALVNLSQPINPESGDFWYDTAKHKLFVYDGVLNIWVGIGPADATTVGEGVITLTTDVNNPSTFSKITLPIESVSNLELTITAKEVIPTLEKGIREPECACWKVKTCANSYKNQYEGVLVDSVLLVGNPSVERIAASDNAMDWEQEISGSAGDSTLRVDVNGTGLSSASNIGEVSWTIYYKYVRA